MERWGFCGGVAIGDKTINLYVCKVCNVSAKTNHDIPLNYVHVKNVTNVSNVINKPGSIFGIYFINVSNVKNVKNLNESLS